MFGVTAALNPATTVATLAFVGTGVALGTISGLIPGLHANNMALLLAGVAAAMLAAGVVHTFLGVVPMLALGVPDAAMAAGTLPGHRLVLQGRGHEALRLSTLGSGLAVALVVPLAVPVTRLMTVLYPHVAAHLPVVLLGTATLLVLTESTPSAALAGAGCFCASAALGVLTLDIDPAAPLAAGGMLAPLFAGLSASVRSPRRRRSG